MKLKRMEIEGFRAFGARQEVDLAADVVILVGTNGSGKTSLFDAVLWALTGSLARVEEAEGSVISKFASSGEARVALQLGSDGQDDLWVIRSRSAEDTGSRLQIRSGENVVRGPEATTELLRLLWPEALSAPDSNAALAIAVTRSVYLQQDLVRQFVESASDRERFEAVSELVGVGRIRELQAQLETGRKAWSQATNELEREGEARRERLNALDAQLEKLEAEKGDEVDVSKTWEVWRAELARLVPRAPTPHDHADSPEASQALDASLRLLLAEARQNDMRLAETRSLISELEQLGSGVASDDDDPESMLAAARGRVNDARAALVAAQSAASAERQASLALRERTAQLAALAELALQHLDEHCPVCTQTYDREKTVEHLEALRLSAGDDVRESPSAGRVEECGRALATAESEVRVLETGATERRRRHEALRVAITRAAKLLGSDASGGSSEIKDLLAEEATRTAQHGEAIGLLRARGEALALDFARSGERVRRNVLAREREGLAETVSREVHNVTARRTTGELAGALLEQLRDSAASLVDEQLQRIEPLAQRIYSRVDPNPVFRTISLTSSFKGGRGRVFTEVKDEVTGADDRRPGTILSSSQLNALAVSVFLALNLGVPAVPMETVMLDDPLQSLDDVNLLGLVDLLRRTKQRRQLLISTHDHRFAALLQRKLRPVAGGRTAVIHLSGWRREGPDVTQEEIPPERDPLRLVA